MAKITAFMLFLIVSHCHRNSSASRQRHQPVDSTQGQPQPHQLAAKKLFPELQQKDSTKMDREPSLFDITKSGTHSPGIVHYQAAENHMKKGHHQLAMNAYLISCSHGYALGCHRYGYHLSQQGNWANARKFYERSCQMGVGKSCNNLGWALEQVGAFTEARNYYSWGCLKKHQRACQNLSRLHQLTSSHQ